MKLLILSYRQNVISVCFLMSSTIKSGLPIYLHGRVFVVVVVLFCFVYIYLFVCEWKLGSNFVDIFVSSLLPPYRCQGSSLGHQAWCRRLCPLSHLTNPVFNFI